MLHRTFDRAAASAAAGVLFGTLGTAGAVGAQSIDDYALTRTFTLPAGSVNVWFDDLPDGRLLVLNGNQVSVESAVGSGVFDALGTVPNYDPAFGPTFLKVSPDGTRAVAGTNGEGFVAVFDTADPSSSTNFSVGDFDAAWLDDDRVAIANFSSTTFETGVELLDTTDGTVTPLIVGLGGASSGITFDAAGNLYTGNGFDFTPGGSDTGSIKAFAASDIQSAITGGTTIDFEASGIEVADLLSASSLGFDDLGNLFVGGADFFGGSGDLGYAALVDGDAIDARLADPVGAPVVDTNSPAALLRQFPSPQDTIDAMEPPLWVFNEATSELYLKYRNFDEVQVFQVPEPGVAALLGGLGLLALRRRRRVAGCVAAGSLVLAASASASPYADAVVSYDPGLNAAPGFTDPATALGEPTRATVPTSPFGGATTPFQPAFGADEIVSIGESGQLTVSFDDPVTDDPANPFGIDLLVFGNAFYTDADFPNGLAGGLFGEGGVIEVSADGVDFFEVTGLDADGAFPTLGYLDPTGAVTAGGNQVTGTVPSDFLKPVDPAFDPAGKTLAEILTGYDGSGGGVGVDLASVGLGAVSYVRVSNPSGSGVTPEIDGFADVAAAASGVVGDYNDSGQVEQGDLDLVLQNWGRDTGVEGVPAGWLSDLPSGSVEQSELDGVLQNWGGTGAPEMNGTVVPEPASLFVLITAAVGLDRRSA